MKQSFSCLLVICAFLSACAYGPNSGAITQKDIWGSINKKGQLVPKISEYPFSEGLAVYRKEGDTDLYGYMNQKGEVVINPEYESATEFSEGLAQVVLPDGNFELQDDREIFIDKQGKSKFTLQKGVRSHGYIAEQSGFKNGRLMVFDISQYSEKNGWVRLYGYIDKAGRMVIPMSLIGNEKLNYPYQFSEGLAAFAKNGLIGFMDTSGRTVIKPQYYEVDEKGFSNGLALVRLNHPSGINTQDTLWDDKEKWAFIDKQNRIKIQLQGGYGGSFSDGLARRRIDNMVTDSNGKSVRVSKWGYLNTNGTMAIEPQFRDANDFSEGLAAVRAWDKKQPNVGYVDKTGKWAIPPKYWSGSQFKSGVATVCLDDSEFRCTSP